VDAFLQFIAMIHSEDFLFFSLKTFHIHDCSRSRSDEEFFHVPHKFYLDVKAIADQDPSEIAAICGL